jgi:hypothetical protein
VCYRSSSFEIYGKDNSGYSSQLNYSTEDSYLQYCYVMDNYANKYDCIGFYNNKHTCEESNIINNSGKESNSDILNCFNSAIVTINKCCFLNNNLFGSGLYLFWVGSGTMYVKECKIQNGYKYTISSGNFYTSYSNTVAGNECAAITKCGANLGNTEECKCKCSVYDNMLINNLYRLYVNKRFLL